MKRLIVAVVAGLLAISSNAEVAKIKVACLGDSITVGSQCSDRKTKSYPAVLQKLLGDGYEVRNYGQGGTNGASKGNPWRSKTKHMETSLAWGPDIVVWMHGTNDSTHWVGQGFTEDWYVADIKEVLDKYLALKPKKLIVVNPPTLFQRDKMKIWGIDAQQLDDHLIPAVNRLAKELKVPLVDFYKLSSTHRDDWYAKDLCHLNDAGYAALAEEVKKAIVK